jgi:hypothetical protein
VTGSALARMLTQARALREGFASTAPQPWDAVTAAAELAVQLGHLAQCIGRQAGISPGHLEDPARPITDTGDELADVALAILSIAILSGDEPAAALAAAVQDSEAPDARTTLLITLVIVAGQLAESAMVTAGYRHRPAGSMPSVAAASGAALAAAARLAAAAGVDLPVAFDAMTADAQRFLAARAAAGGLA